jgi:hypothetical protein
MTILILLHRRSHFLLILSSFGKRTLYKHPHVIKKKSAMPFSLDSTFKKHLASPTTCYARSWVVQHSALTICDLWIEIQCCLIAMPSYGRCVALFPYENYKKESYIYTAMTLHAMISVYYSFTMFELMRQFQYRRSPLTVFYVWGTSIFIYTVEERRLTCCWEGGRSPTIRAASPPLPEDGPPSFRPRE